MRLLPSGGRPALAVVAIALTAAGLAGCSAKNTASDSGATTTTTTSAGAGTSPAACTPDQLHLYSPGKLTIATDSPAYAPWFKKNDPSNGAGYESAVAYAVAQQLGFSKDQVTWVKESFNNSYTPGPKKFDFDINQISITPERAKAVTFSHGYYTADQAVITLAKNKDKATTLAGLKSLKLGAETATTSLTAIRDDVQPSSQPLVFDTDDQAKQALLHGQIDGLVTDLPSAGYMSSEIKGSVVVGRFANKEPEEFGLLFQQGNPLVTCVNQAIDKLQSDGTLTQLQQQWLSGMENVPVLK
ncbi:ABC transporter substrate-binding protein [Nocardioides sp.]|jgi:polar amino acid transport system substrate-binding protein|uniref:ABC transporter substrate-binding protein n=1 Tax=Nocardioides sp. TaxID=35761 RepID=UPI002B761479|nr:ABC transporter substrate-binding protein [Nocardioides sp.]HVX55541.1 ABC transporter substrate-binding protein [Nocardioides sp.]